MARDLESLRNIGIIAHIDAGKTTVTERMLYVSGAKHRAGGVDSGTTETDDDPEEQERGITIYSACVTFNWKKITINLLDTPGHVDFTAEVERCLRVLDGAVVVFSGREGVEAQSETVWRQADKYNVPRIVFINKLDREGADFYRVLDEIGPRLNAQPVPVQIPVGMGPPHVKDPFRGVIDLVDMRLLRFSAEDDGKQVADEPIPEELLDDAQTWREMLLESLYSINTEMMEMALEEKPIPPEVIRRALRAGCIAREIQPVLCGSALHGMGVQPLLDGVGHYLPTPLERPPVIGVDPKKRDKELQRLPSVDEAFCALVFKILPAKTGDLYWIRVYSGKLESNSRVYNPNRDKKENIAQLWQIHATKKERQGQVQTLECGDIACAIGPRMSITGDTLCDTREMIELPSIQFAQAVLSMAIEPENTAERKKLSEVLEMLKRQDPTFNAVENEESGQTLISGMGELHLDVIKHRLTRDFNLNVKFYKPRVSYRETIGSKATVTGQCNRQIGATQLFARVDIIVEPLEDRASDAIVLDQFFGEHALPDNLKAAVMEELRSRAQGGGAIGSFPLTGLKISLVGGEMREVGSDEVAFRIAANDAFEQALQQGTPTLLEPVMRLDIITPEDYLGEIAGDLQQRRATIESTESRGTMTGLIAFAPLKELFGYSSAIRSLSQGRAGCSMEPHGYQAAPESDVESFGF
ncbi:elongation factor G [Aureliella helgolandensis]|uniref:Elongation factor G n=1 Tax=Aureliella helgolandensis TaxID=2527968 RepID=A0A518G373_9BACT|nr:elongation factor G [Aureliella helgolandensis]QDV23042.1 Elongation factor G [Aureliella helgolandensis]